MNLIKPIIKVKVLAGIGIYGYVTYSHNKELINRYEEITGHKFKQNDKYKLYLKYNAFENFNEPGLLSTKNYFIHYDRSNRLEMKSLLSDRDRIYIDTKFVNKFIHSDDVIITKKEFDSFSLLDPFFTTNYYKFMYKAAHQLGITNDERYKLLNAPKEMYDELNNTSNKYKKEIAKIPTWSGEWNYVYDQRCEELNKIYNKYGF